MADGQLSSFLYLTSNHNAHDSCWLLQGAKSAVFCYACAIENLEDIHVLNIRKKNILTELLEVVMLSRQFWKLLVSKQSVLAHSLRLFVHILGGKPDHELIKLIEECLQLFMKRTCIESSSHIVAEAILTLPNFLATPGLVCVLAMLASSLPSPWGMFSLLNPAFFELVVKEVRVCEANVKLSLWQLIAAILQDQERVCKSGSNKVLKSLLETCVDSYNGTMEVDLHLVLLTIFQTYCTISDLRLVLLAHESSDMTPLSLSVFEVLKKALLSATEQIQIAAISVILATSECCSSEELGNSKDLKILSLIEVALEKGICEFLFELLSSQSSSILKSLYSCLTRLIQFPYFFRHGHAMYGITPVLHSVKNSLKDFHTTELGLRFITALLQESQRGGINLVPFGAGLTQLLLLLKECFAYDSQSVKMASVACILHVLQQLNCNDSDVLCHIIEFAEELACLVETISISNVRNQEQETVFVCHCFLVIGEITKMVKNVHQVEEPGDVPDKECSDNVSNGSSASSCITSQKRILYYVADKYLIPAAVSRFFRLRHLDFDAAFYQMLHNVLELDIQYGKALAKKLAESSFIKLITDFRVTSMKSCSPEVETCLCNIQFYLCISVEDEVLSKTDKEQFRTALKHFSTPIREWRSVLIGVVSCTNSKESMANTLLCIFALLAYTQKCGSCLVPVDTLFGSLQKFASVAQNLVTLTTLGKRYFLFVFIQSSAASSHVSPCDIATSKNVSDLLCSSIENAESLYMHSTSFLVWLTKSGISLATMITYAEQFILKSLSSSRNSKMDIRKEISSKISSADNSLTAIELLVHVVSSSENTDARKLCTEVLKITFGDCKVSHNILEIVRKIFMAKSAEMSSEICAALFSIANMFSIYSSGDVTADQMKLFCRALSLCNTAPLSCLQQETLNFMYVCMVWAMESLNTAPVSIVLSNEAIFEDFEKQVFNNQNIIEFSDGCPVLERNASAAVLFMSQLFHCYSSSSLAEMEKPKLKISKHLLIRLICCNKVPILQISSLRFWMQVFQMHCKSQLFKFVDTNGGDCAVSSHDVKLILVGLQNVLVSQCSLLRKAASECMESLLVNIPCTQEYASLAWNTEVLLFTSESIQLNGLDYANIKVVATLCKYEVAGYTNILPVICSVLETLATDKEELPCPTSCLYLLEMMCDKFSETFTKEQCQLFHKFSKLLNTKLSSHNQAPRSSDFDSMNGVLLHNLEKEASTCSHISRGIIVMNRFKSLLYIDDDSCSDAETVEE